jgi:hypothetical protein
VGTTLKKKRSKREGKGDERRQRCRHDKIKEEQNGKNTTKKKQDWEMPKRKEGKPRQNRKYG